MKYDVTIKYHSCKSLIEIDAKDADEARKLVQLQYEGAWDGDRVRIVEVKKSEAQ